jgi:alpha-mannosidase
VPPEPAANDTSVAARRARRTRERINTSGRRMLPEFSGTLTPGFIKRAPVAWFASHHHLADGSNDPYAFAYLFAYAIDLPANAATLTLPDDETIRVLAVTVSDEGERVRPARPLYDVLGGGGAR